MGGICMGRNLEERRWETSVKIFTALLGVILAVVCIGSGFQWPPRNVFDSEPWCWARQISNKTLFGTWDWVCVRCHSEPCIQEWGAQRRMYTVSIDTCHEKGGFFFSEP